MFSLKEDVQLAFNLFCILLRLTKTNVRIVSERWSEKYTVDKFLPDNGSVVFLPIEDLTSDTLEIKEVPKKNSRGNGGTLKSSIENLLTNSFTEDTDQDDNLTQVQVSDIHFKTGLTLPGKDGLSWHFELTAQFLDKPQDKMTFDQLSKLYFLADGHKEFAPLLNYLRPFFTRQEWSDAELNSKLKRFQLETKEQAKSQLEDEILDRLNKGHDTTYPKLDGDSLQAFQKHCLESIADFDAVEAKEKLPVILKRLQKIVQALNCLYGYDSAKFQKELRQVMFDKIGSKMTLPYNVSLSEKVSILHARLATFAIPTRQIILDKFSTFALRTWCPVFIDILLRICLPMCKVLIADCLLRLHGNLQVFESFFQLFMQLQILAKHCEGKEFEVQEIFQPCLEKWAKCAADKAKIQIEKALEFRRKNDVESMSPKKNEHGKQKSSLAFSIKSGKASTASLKFQWSLDESEKESAKIETKHVYDIFSSCHKTWEDLHWTVPEQSLTYGLYLFNNLRPIFQYYIHKLQEIVLEDKHFDHLELALSLNCLFNSAHFSKRFEGTLKHIIAEMTRNEVATGSN